MSDNNAAGNNTAATESFDAPQEVPQGQQAAPTPTGGEEAGKTAESPPESYVLDFGSFADNVPPDEAAFLSQMAQQAGIDSAKASILMQNLALYSHATQDVQAKEWADACRSDAEFGGDNLEANIAIANKALKAYGSEALIEMFHTSPIGNHPEAIRFLWKVGQTLSEDRMDGTRAGAPGGFDARDFFPNSNMNP